MGDGSLISWQTNKICNQKDMRQVDNAILSIQ